MFNNTKKERHRKEIHECSQLYAQNAQMKQQLESAIQTRRTEKIEARSRCLICDQQRREEASRIYLDAGGTHRGVVQQLDPPAVTLEIPEQQGTANLDIKANFLTKQVLKNMPRYFRGLEQDLGVEYPKIVPKLWKRLKENRDWNHPMRSVKDILENFADKRTLLNVQVKLVLGAVEKEIRLFIAATFKKSA